MSMFTIFVHIMWMQSILKIISDLNALPGVTFHPRERVVIVAHHVSSQMLIILKEISDHDAQPSVTFHPGERVVIVA